MDHSLKAYIERQPTEKLEKFLEDFYEGRLAEDCTHVIPYIEYVIQRRKEEK